MAEVLSIIKETDAIEKSLASARESAEQAVQVLSAVPDNDHKRALEALARYSVDRQH